MLDGDDFVPPHNARRFNWLTLDTVVTNGLSFIINVKGGRSSGASILCEVPCQQGNERRQKHHHEEWQAGSSGRMPDLWHQNVQNRQGLGLRRRSPTELKRAGFSRYRDLQPFYFAQSHISSFHYPTIVSFVGSGNVLRNALCRFPKNIKYPD